jgi:hypothetical protein
MPNHNDHDLLIRIDERQNDMAESLETLATKMDRLVPNNTEYKQMKLRVENLWDSKNRVIGWMLGAGIAGGGVVALIRGGLQVLGVALK